MNKIAEKFSHVTCSVILVLHDFTGCDTCSAFKGIGKVKPIKVLQKNAKFNAMLARLGDNWEILDDMLWDAEELTCVLFGKPRFKSVNELRFHLLKAKRHSEGKITNNTNIEITNMPPCSDSLREHVWSQLPSCDLETGTCNKTRCAINPSTVHGWVFWRMTFLSPCGWVVNTSITNRYSKFLWRWWGMSQCRVRYGQKIWAPNGIWESSWWIRICYFIAEVST